MREKLWGRHQEDSGLLSRDDSGLLSTEYSRLLSREDSRLLSREDSGLLSRQAGFRFRQHDQTDLNVEEEEMLEYTWLTHHSVNISFLM